MTFEKIISKLLVLGLFSDHGAVDGVLNPEEACVLSEELKWASRTESMKLNGQEREVDTSSSNLRTQTNAQKCWDDVSELPPVCSSLPPTSGQLLNSADKTETNDDQLFRPHSRPSYPVQPVGDRGQLHSVTPIKLCRRELRQISASELLLRRSGLGVGVGSVITESIQASRKPSDLKT